MVRTALWLMTEVGVGKSFTKEQHRRAFTGVTQADRRLRDLRAYGWVIHTSAEDVTLRPEEQRFVAPGAQVWEAGQRRAADVAVPAADRMAVFAANDYQCIVCGIAGGETYADAPHMTAVLSAARRDVVLHAGETRTMYVAECKRCRAGEPDGRLIDVSILIEDVNRLDDRDRAILKRWMTEGRRAAVDRVWASVRRLPAEIREQLRKTL
jgi:hypothetical protein